MNTENYKLKQLNQKLKEINLQRPQLLLNKHHLFSVNKIVSL